MDKEIDKFLDDYIKDNVYNYAVMIDGAWGSGKTFYIKNYIESKSEKENFIYVSLYGIKNTEDISNMVYSQIINNLKVVKKISDKIDEKITNKKARCLINTFGGKFFSDLCRNKGINIDEIQNISKELIDLSSYRFIFDDLERCECKINEVLGYINNLVEHNEVKAIIIANEKEIKNSSSEINLYNRAKEKLIANTFKYNPNLKEVFSLIINENLKYDAEMKNMLEEFMEIFLNSSNQNIRTFQFFLSKFKRIYDNVSFINNSIYKNEIFQAYIKEFYHECTLYKSSNNEINENDVNSFKFLRRYISTGYINEKEVIENIESYIDFYEKSIKNSNLWRLKSWYALSELEVKEVIEEMLKDIKSGEDDSRQFGEIIKVLIILNDIGFDEEYINRAKECMKKAISINDRPIDIFLFEDTFSNNRVKNKSMVEKFTVIIKEINDTFYNKENNVYKDEALDILKSDNFIDKLKELGYSKGNEKLRSIFINFDIDLLVEKLISIDNKGLYDFRSFFYLIYFKNEDIDVLELFKKKIEQVKLDSFDIIKTTTLKWLIEDVKSKISIL